MVPRKTHPTEEIRRGPISRADPSAGSTAAIVLVGDRYVTVGISSFAWPDDLTQDQVRDGLQVLARSAVSRRRGQRSCLSVNERA